MFVLGVLMEGKVYGLNGGDLLDMLGFVGDLGAGSLYFVTRMMDWGKGAIQLASADYGTKFIIVAGLGLILVGFAYSVIDSIKQLYTSDDHAHIAINLLTDMLQAVIDPRVKLG